jgi:hypothetical protein
LRYWYKSTKTDAARRITENLIPQHPARKVEEEEESEAPVKEEERA